jgi:hypothetical protein
MILNQFHRFSTAFVAGVCCCIAAASHANDAVQPSATWVQLSPGVAPPARSYLAMAYSPAGGRVVMFGGFDGSGYLNDTWTFDGTLWHHISTSVAPPPRAAAQMAYDSHTRKIILFGGYNGRNYLGDTWLWDGKSRTRAQPAHHPKAVTSPMLFTDPNGHVDVYGGFDGNFYQYSMWQWTGSDWNRLSLPSLPYARSAAAIGVNGVTGDAVLFGGLADVNPVNTWTYDGTTWTMQFPRKQPVWVYAASAAFDQNLNALFFLAAAAAE